ncbi:GTPase domain-containing protein [Nostoc sp. ChiSLP03a]|uniref:GTPase domain-containing protein n=1 Tax=Nostoc sp. ChiSLP03a TaxID=3075380 RepID=UPI002AD43A32|nr:GTPase domain-containing protein [Nostoc sp. ChiSLP03a]MDZ8214567.1 GTPase domain-containing protein [Nostoc sp. ChiSLP03a]
MKFMVLGFSGVGKTFYLGSLFKLRYDIGPRGIALQDKNFTEKSWIGNTHEIMTGIEVGSISSTMGLIDSSMVLTKGMDQIVDIEITDVEGQALNQKSGSQTAQKLISTIEDYDGLILIVKAPRNLQEAERSKEHLGQMLNFAREALKGNERIPMALVLNQIDLLPELHRIKPRLEEELEKLEAELDNKYGGNYSLIEQQLRIRKGEVVNKFVKPAVNTRAVFQVYHTFFRFIKATKLIVPNKVFPCTSLGFVNTGDTLDFATYLAESGQIYEPYGSAASFLWVIYARLKTLPKVRLMEIMPNEAGSNLLVDDLLEDIRDLHTSGKAYFDPDQNNPTKSGIWSLRNISLLESHTMQA